MPERPETRYVLVGGSDVGYQVVGKGTPDLVWIHTAGHNTETQWDFSPLANGLNRLASFSRLIMFDGRGMGISEAPQEGALPTWESGADDLKAVLDAVGSIRAAFLGEFDGAARAALFAATFPERTTSLVLWNPYARVAVSDDYPLGQSPETLRDSLRALGMIWGTVDYARMIMPSLAEDDDLMRTLARVMRTGATPHAMEKNFRFTFDIDIRPALAAIRVPTLVLHRVGGTYIPEEWSRYVADQIPDARFVSVKGADAVWYGEGADETASMIEEFITGVAPRTKHDRQLATLLFTDIVSSTERAASMGDRRWKEFLEEHDRTAHSLIRSASGRLINTTGDGILATFDGPGRAIRCAMELGNALARHGVQIRAGVHIGEVERRSNGDVGGMAVHIAARVMSEAGPGEVLVSRTVKDLVVGSEYAFEDRGAHTLKGVADEWQLYAVRQT